MVRGGSRATALSQRSHQISQGSLLALSLWASATFLPDLLSAHRTRTGPMAGAACEEMSALVRQQLALLGEDPQRHFMCWQPTCVVNRDPNHVPEHFGTLVFAK